MAASDVMSRPAVRWLNYRGDKSHVVGQTVGSTTVGDFLTAVEATYDPKADTTRVGFAFGMPAGNLDGIAFVMRGRRRS